MSAFYYRLREAAGALLRSPGYTLTVTLTLALTLGALISVFALSHTLLWKPLPWPEADRLVHLGGRMEMGQFQGMGLPRRLLHDWKDEPQLEQLSRVYVERVPVQWPDGAVQSVALVTDSTLFSLLGARAQLGQLFGSDASLPQASVVISAALWKKRFGARHEVIGRSLEIGNQSYRIVGVLHEDVLIPEFLSKAPDLFLQQPLADDPSRRSTYNGFANNVHGLARLKAGVTPAAVAPALKGYWQRGRQAEAGAGAGPAFEFTALVQPVRQALVGDSDRVVGLLLVGVVLLVAISLSSLASLVLARAAARNSEYALREAVGLSPGGVRLHLAVEMLLLMAATTLLALVLALWGIELIRMIGRSHLPMLEQAGIDSSALLFAAALGVFTAALLTAMAIAGLRQENLRERLQAVGKGATGGRVARPLRQLLMGAQLTLVALLVLGAVTLIGSSWREIQQDRGMDPRGLLGLQISLRGMEGPKTEDIEASRRWWADFEAQMQSLRPRVQQALRSQPGWQQVVRVDPAPFGNTLTMATVEDAEGKSLGMVETVVAETAFFKMAGLRFLAGEPWQEAAGSGAADAVVINRTLALALGGVDKAIGKTLRSDKLTLRVVGVVQDVGREPGSFGQMFQNAEQKQAAMTNAISYLVRSSAALPDREALQRSLQTLDARLQVESMGELASNLREQLNTAYLSAYLAAALAALGVALAVAGVFGASAYQSRLRRPEFGLRLALGAWPQRLLREQVRDALPAIIVGLAVAAAAVGWGAPLLKARGIAMPELQWLDAVLAAAVLLTIALLAVTVAARREIARSPWQSLRND